MEGLLDSEVRWERVTPGVRGRWREDISNQCSHLVINATWNCSHVQLAEDELSPFFPDEGQCDQYCQVVRLV